MNRRDIFRQCLRRFEACQTNCWSSRPQRERRSPLSYSRRNEEYLADFLLIAKRTLDPQEYEVFHWHHLYGAEWTLVARKLKLSREAYRQRLWAVEERLGQALAETRPYPLWPLTEYFAGSYQGAGSAA